MEEQTEVIGLENQAQPTEEIQNLEMQGLQGDETKEGDQPQGEKKEDIPKGVERRLKALTRQKYELQRELEDIKSNLNRPSEQVLHRENYTEEEWIKLQVQQTLKAEREALRQEEAQRRMAEAQAESMKKQIEVYKEVIPDFDEVLEDANDIQVPNVAIDFIRDSEIATLLTYHITKNEEVQDRLLELAKSDRTGRKVERYLAKIESKLEEEFSSRKAPNKPRTTQAPPPVGKPTAPQGNAGNSTFDPLKLSASEYRKWKQQGGLKNLR